MAQTTRERIEEVVPRLLARDLRGVVDVPELYLRAAGVLDDLGDARAAAVVETGHDILMEQAERITDPDRRRRFLQDLPPHRDLAQRAGLGGAGPARLGAPETPSPGHRRG